MLAPIVDVKGELIGLHRTYLAADGSGKADVEKPKLMLGRAKGGAVRLTDCGSKLAIAEGIETALSVLVEEKVPTWAALSTSGLTTIELPRSVLEAVIYADADSAGIEAARAARRRLSALGHAVDGRLRVGVHLLADLDVHPVSAERREPALSRPLVRRTFWIC
jgi:hypothetical protein